MRQSLLVLITLFICSFNLVSAQHSILVAEDNLANQLLTRLLLEKMGFEVTVVQDGFEALESVKSRDFDLIFMDIMMPKMNGYEAARAIKQAGYDIPVIALTANAMKGDGKKCLAAGCDEYLSKPLVRSELLKVISKFMRQKT